MFEFLYRNHISNSQAFHRKRNDAMDSLFELIPSIADSFSSQFTTHELIIALAQKHQREYIEALYEHRESERPFGTIHSKIGKYLKRTNFVRFVRLDEVDKDIFGQASKTLWEKIT